MTRAAISLATAVGRGALPSLEILVLDQNRIGDAGCIALATALGRGAMASLKRLYISQEAPALKAACKVRGILFH